MTTQINLRRLAERESEQVEWKQNVADVNDVVKTLSAFANDLANLGGGYVVCGAQEEKDEHGFPRLVQAGLTANRIREVEGEVLTRCRTLVAPAITPLVDELPSPAPDRRILVFIQPATPQAHAFRSQDGGRHYVRVSRTTPRSAQWRAARLAGPQGCYPSLGPPALQWRHRGRSGPARPAGCTDTHGNVYGRTCN